MSQNYLKYTCIFISVFFFTSCFNSSPSEINDVPIKETDLFIKPEVSVKEFANTPLQFHIDNKKPLGEEFRSDGKDTMIIRRYPKNNPSTSITQINVFMLNADIRDSVVKVGVGNSDLYLRVGMTMDQFKNSFTDFKENRKNPYVKIKTDKTTKLQTIFIYSSDPYDESTTKWKFEFDEDNLLDRISYDSYVDIQSNPEDFKKIKAPKKKKK